MSDELMQELSTWLTALADACIFPGRVRVFCDERSVGVLSTSEREACEWQGATGGCLIAAACGAAVVEAQRQGHVVVIIPAQSLADEHVRTAALLAVRLQLNVLTMVIVSDKIADSAWLIANGWRRAGTGPVVKHVAPPASAAGKDKLPPPRIDNDVQPVHLPILVPGALPPWPVDSLSTPLSSIADWLSWLSVREPMLTVADLTNRWQSLPPTSMLLAALAQYSSEGRRVCWRVPTGIDIRGWLAVMYEIGRRGLAIKLLISVNDLPSRPQLAALTGWWVLVPNDVGEAAAMLAHALESEDPVLLALPTVALPALPKWQREQAFMPGSGRWFCQGTSVIVVCDHRTSLAATTAATDLDKEDIHISVLICSSLIPLPIGELDQVPFAPIVACGNDLGVAWSSALIDQKRKITTVGDGTNPTVIADMVRKLLKR